MLSQWNAAKTGNTIDITDRKVPHMNAHADRKVNHQTHWK